MIKEFHGCLVSDDGTVYNNGIAVKPYAYHHSASTIPHLVFQIYPNGKKKSFVLARVIAELFVDNPKNLPSVINIDNDINNCEAENLKWVTRTEKINWALSLKEKLSKPIEYEFVGSPEYGYAF